MMPVVFILALILVLIGVILIVLSRVPNVWDELRWGGYFLIGLAVLVGVWPGGLHG